MHDLLALQQKAREAGRPLIGCFPPYPPLELFTALGLTPLVLWNLGDWQDGVSHADRHVQVFACAVARRLAEACLGPAGAGFDALFAYNTCDTLRNLPEVIQRARPGLPLRRMHLPQTHPPQAHAQAYLAGELRDLAAGLAADLGVTCRPEALAAAVARHEHLRALARQAGELAHQGRLPFRRYARVMNQVWLSSLEHGEALLGGLLAAAAAAPAPARAKVVLSGIEPPPGPLLGLLEEAGLRVVADDLAGLSRALHPGAAQPTELGAYYADYYQGHHPCSTLLYSAERRRGLLPALARQSGAHGVIFVGEKFCECEYFEFPELAGELSRAGLPSLLLEVALDDRANLEGFRTRVEAFAETITPARKEG
ncbi:MAG: 2-hydroxyacyl-CoA dehydratase family protein [Deltaproteobacteria bacterium]|nr:2-hydroxyacyl-CoA dehydratase family protein [Deltaproteobacteria bacterium]